MTPADLYDASLEPLRYGICTYRGSDHIEHAALAIRYHTWPPPLLRCLRDALSDGITITIRSEQREIYIQSRSRVQICTHAGVHRSVLDAPAWDATLEQVDGAILAHFERVCAKQGAFELTIQGQCLEFATVVENNGGVGRTSILRPIQHPIPSA